MRYVYLGFFDLHIWTSWMKFMLADEMETKTSAVFKDFFANFTRKLLFSFGDNINGLDWLNYRPVFCDSMLKKKMQKKMQKKIRCKRVLCTYLSS
jgi:hypothetical protein